jgi:hypothetical protein
MPLKRGIFYFIPIRNKFIIMKHSFIIVFVILFVSCHSKHTLSDEELKHLLDSATIKTPTYIDGVPTCTIDSVMQWDANGDIDVNKKGVLSPGDKIMDRGTLYVYVSDQSNLSSNPNRASYSYESHSDTSSIKEYEAFTSRGLCILKLKMVKPLVYVNVTKNYTELITGTTYTKSAYYIDWSKTQKYYFINIDGSKFIQGPDCSMGDELKPGDKNYIPLNKIDEINSGIQTDTLNTDNSDRDVNFSDSLKH